MSASTRTSDAQALDVAASLRLFLVRHGETDANVRGLVVGQSDTVS